MDGYMIEFGIRGNPQRVLEVDSKASIIGTFNGDKIEYHSNHPYGPVEEVFGTFKLSKNDISYGIEVLREVLDPILEEYHDVNAYVRNADYVKRHQPLYEGLQDVRNLDIGNWVRGYLYDESACELTLGLRDFYEDLIADDNVMNVEAGYNGIGFKTTQEYYEPIKNLIGNRARQSDEDYTLILNNGYAQKEYEGGALRELGEF